MSRSDDRPGSGLGTLLWLAALAGALAACESSSGGGTPAPVPCTSPAECGTSELCLAGEDGATVCTEVECGCLACSACAEGRVCQQGSCVDGAPPCLDAYCAGAACSAATPCPDGQRCVDGACWSVKACFDDTGCAPGQTCEAHECLDCDAGACLGADCAEGECAEGMVCNPFDDTCVEEGSGLLDPACRPCTTVEDCGETDYQCMPRSTGQFCLPPCQDNEGCKTGWTCFTGVCVPLSTTCTGCTYGGCDEGEACDPFTGACHPVAGRCEACEQDWECGPGAACRGFGPANERCVPRCGPGGACPGAATCGTDEDSGYAICIPPTGICCFEDDPADCGTGAPCEPACAGLTPLCNDGSCVECLSDTDCTGGATCNTGTGFCEGGGSADCQDPTPYYDPAKDQCVQCINTSHCEGGACNAETGTCEDEFCDTCVAPYPACIELQGEHYCAQCSVNSHCGAGGVCNPTTFSCENGTVDPSLACESDEDCDPGMTTFNLKCQVETGICYDPSGKCDDVTAFCIGGFDCFFITQALGGGIPLPTPEDGGETLTGTCECDISDCAEGLPSCPCPPGTCGEFMGGLFPMGFPPSCQLFSFR